MTEQVPEVDAEYIDPFEGLTFEPYDPAEAVNVPQATPLGTGEDTEANTEPFNERHREDFEGLMYLGALSARFSFLGHRFHIRTLTTDELLAAAQIIKPYEGTTGGARAYATALVSLAIVSVDGTGLPVPVEENGDYGWAYDRFNYVKARWYPYVIDYVYDQLLLLERRVREVLGEMMEQAKKAPGQTGPIAG